MTKPELTRLRWLEGRQVMVALRDGSRLDDCQLISLGHNEVPSVWLFANGSDRFVPAADVLDVREYVA